MKYILQSDRFNGDINIEYNELGLLKALHVNAELEPNQWQWLRKDFPVTIDILFNLESTSSLRVTEVSDDLSFGVFWEAYKYKVGNKKQAEKIWNLLSEVDQVSALASIPKYLHWLACRPNMEQTHATTWLNQRRWENDYSRK